MKKRVSEEYLTKAKKREIKNRPRMKMHAASLKRVLPHAGKKITAR
jgi:hypothetical protein